MPPYCPPIVPVQSSKPWSVPYCPLAHLLSLSKAQNRGLSPIVPYCPLCAPKLKTVVCPLLSLSPQNRGLSPIVLLSRCPLCAPKLKTVVCPLLSCPLLSRPIVPVPYCPRCKTVQPVGAASIVFARRLMRSSSGTGARRSATGRADRYGIGSTVVDTIIVWTTRARPESKADNRSLRWNWLPKLAVTMSDTCAG